MQRLYIFLFALIAVGGLRAQEMTTYCAYDFPDDKIPEGFAQYDVDGETPHFTATQLGFDAGVAWLCLREEGVFPHNYFVASHSRHKKITGQDLQPANDWLVLPSFMVRADDATLSWRSNTICENLEQTSTYSVLVSSVGNQPGDFTEKELLTIDSDAINGWTEHTLSLQGFAGQRIWIAFVNQTLNGELLAIDDIKVEGSQGTYSFRTNLDAYVYGQTTFTPSLTIQNLSDEPIAAFSVTAKNLQTGEETVTPVTEILAAGDSREISIMPTMTVAYGDTLRATVQVQVGDTQSDAITSQTVFLSFAPRQHVVIEEGTGNWCGWCPQGIYAIEVLREKYGDLVLPISVHYDDPMEVDGYIDNNTGIFFAGFPTGHINRKYLVDPLAEVHDGRKTIWTTTNGGFETYVVSELENKPYAEVNVTAKLDGSTLNLSSTTTFCMPQKGSNLRMAYILSEDKWESKLTQKNYMSGNEEYESVGDFSNLPTNLTNFTFEDVARGAAQKAFRGIKGSIPANVEVDTPYSHETTMAVPASVVNIANCSITALLIDYSTGNIINSARVSVDTGDTGITDILNSSSSIFYDLSGRRVSAPSHGLFIVNGKKMILK